MLLSTVIVPQQCSHPEPLKQGGWAGRDHTSTAKGAQSTWVAQSGYKKIRRSCPSSGGAEGWEQVSGGPLP